jgi:hypothetical protein
LRRIFPNALERLTSGNLPTCERLVGTAYSGFPVLPHQLVSGGDRSLICSLPYLLRQAVQQPVGKFSGDKEEHAIKANTKARFGTTDRSSVRACRV